MTACTRIATLLGVALLAPLCAFTPHPTQILGADLIVTAAPAYEPLAALRGAERFPEGAQLLRVHDGSTEPLVAGFAAAADANVSFDATTVLFAGKKAASDPWQIFELTFANGEIRQVTAGASDAIRPLYLPDDRLVYAQRSPHGFAIVTASLNNEPRPAGAHAALAITYLQSGALPVDVLADGRILFESGFPLGMTGAPELYLVYADGSGVESYRCDHGLARWGGRQLASGDVVFTHGTSLARFTSPLAHEERIAAPRADYAGGIVELTSGAWLVSARNSSAARFALDAWQPGAVSLTPILAINGMNLIDPVLITSRTRPHRHPSGLHPWDYANLLALDARLSRDGALKGVPATVRLETQDASGHAVVTGTAPIESDGSFFVQVPGDRPIRIAVLDTKGSVLRQERGWFWARGGEQRICVGCHTGPERAADNRVPAVLERTTTPADCTGRTQTSIKGGR